MRLFTPEYKRWRARDGELFKKAQRVQESGGDSMNLKRRKNQYATARERFIKPALMNFLKAEFPSLGGEKVRMLFVEELMKILDKFYYSMDKIKLGRCDGWH